MSIIYFSDIHILKVLYNSYISFNHLCSGAIFFHSLVPPIPPGGVAKCNQLDGELKLKGNSTDYMVGNSMKRY